MTEVSYSNLENVASDKLRKIQHVGRDEIIRLTKELQELKDRDIIITNIIKQRAGEE